MLARGLPKVKADPTDMQARLDCQIGSWLSMGGLAAGVPMGASHGIGYVLGAVFDVPHGHTSCIMLPWVMRWNKSANADRQALIANAMGHPGKDAGDVLDDFIRGLGMPRSLGEVKIGKEHFDRIATQAMGTPGCRATRARSTGRRRSRRSWSWRHRPGRLSAVSAVCATPSVSLLGCIPDRVECMR